MRLSVWPLMLLGLVLTIVPVACFSRPLIPIEPPKVEKADVPPATTGKLASNLPVAKDIDEAKKDIEQARAQIEFWKVRLDLSIADEKRMVQEERQAWLVSICRWLMGMCIFGMVASGFLFAASFIWPWFANLRYAAMAGLGAAVVVFVIAWYLPTQIFWIGLAVAVCTAGGVLVLVRHSHGLGKMKNPLEQLNIFTDGKVP